MARATERPLFAVPADDGDARQAGVCRQAERLRPVRFSETDMSSPVGVIEDLGGSPGRAFRSSDRSHDVTARIAGALVGATGLRAR